MLIRFHGNEKSVLKISVIRRACKLVGWLVVLGLKAL